MAERDALKIYLPVELADRFRAIARDEDRSVTAIVRRLIREYVAERDSSKEAA